MPILSAGKTNVGRKRKSNQDSIYLSPKLNLYIVADGMGGHSGGDIASALAIKTIPENLANSQEEAPSAKLKSAINAANMAILAKSEEHQNLHGMGTTVVSLLFATDTLYIANVGDSRAYLINKSKIFQLTRDHSLVQEKLSLGLYNREQAANDPHKNVLARTVGFEENLEIDLFTYKVNRNDILLLCSDGLHGLVSDEDIIFLINQIIESPQDASKEQLEQACDALINAALENGGTDNVSVILVLAK